MTQQYTLFFIKITQMGQYQKSNFKTQTSEGIVSPLQTDAHNKNKS